VRSLLCSSPISSSPRPPRYDTVPFDHIVYRLLMPNCHIPPNTKDGVRSRTYTTNLSVCWFSQNLPLRGHVECFSCIREAGICIHDCPCTHRRGVSRSPASEMLMRIRGGLMYPPNISCTAPGVPCHLLVKPNQRNHHFREDVDMT